MALIMGVSFVRGLRDVLGRLRGHVWEMFCGGLFGEAFL